MKRMNISLPDDLHQELGSYRAQINISAACQRALRLEIDRLKPTDATVEPVDEVVERLRAEKRELETTSRKRGFDVGVEWANRASFVDLRRWGARKVRADDLATLKTPLDETYRWSIETGEAFGGQAAAEQYVQRNPEFRPLPVYHSDPWDGAMHFSFDFGDRASFNAGFLDAVSKFWLAVKVRL